MRRLKKIIKIQSIIIGVLTLILSYVLSLRYEYTVNNRVVVSQPIWAYVFALD